MMRMWLALIIAALLSCVGGALLVPFIGIESPPVSTPCPPGSTPERSMPDLSRTIEERLVEAGLTEARVSVTGIQNCPDIAQAASIGWILVTLTVEDVADTAHLGDLSAQVFPLLADWSNETLHLRFQDASDDLLLIIPIQTGLDLLDQGLTGEALYDQLVAQE